MGAGSTAVKVTSVLDSTQEKNWFITDSCSDATCPSVGDKYVCKDPCVALVGSAPAVAVDAFADRAKITEATIGKDKVSINLVNFGTPDIYFAKKLDKNDFTALLSTVRAGWGVGKGANSFLNYLSSKVKLEGTGFSFNLHSSIASAIFGGK